MSGNGGIYAVKKRKRPVQKLLKPTAHDDMKSNPSKRHRDRLNGELNKLAALLPFSGDLQEHPDKLSVPRLSLGYLKLRFAFNPKDDGDVPGNTECYNPRHLPPENSAFLERSFCCRFRCLLDNSSGFLALNLQGRLKCLTEEETHVERSSVVLSHLALFAVACPIEQCGVLEIRTKTFIFQTKHKLDFAPLGIDTRGKVVLGYTEIELCSRSSGYQFIHAADMMYCADSHLRMLKKGESGFAVFRLLAKNGMWVWVQANAQVVFKGGKPDFIIARQKPLTNEEGEEHLRQRSLQLPFTFAGEAVLYETFPTLENPALQSCLSNSKKTRSPEQTGLGPNSVLGSLFRQDLSVCIQPTDPEIQGLLDQTFVDSHTLSIPSAIHKVDPQEPILEQIAENGGREEVLNDLDVSQAELMEWDNTLLRIHLERGDGPAQLNDILASDVFAYVEEALLKETSLKDCKQSEPKGTNMGKGKTFESKPMEVLQNVMLPTKPNSDSAVYGFQEQSKSSKRNMSGFLSLGFQPLLLKSTDHRPHSPS